MHYLIVANLLFSASLIAAAIGVGLYFLFRRQRRKQAVTLPDDPSRDYVASNARRRTGGSLNYSSFVYLDADRDGRYGIGDRPMGGIVVRLSGIGGGLRSSRTNGNGFANFTMSTRARKAQIRSPGTYRFAVSVPPGWTCTSANEDQSMAFDLIEGSPAGIGAAEMVKPVGIAPLRFVGGRVADGAAATLHFLRGDDTVATESPRQGAEFSLDAPEEADAVLIDDGAGKIRRLTLSAYPTNVGAISSSREVLPADAVLETIDFNDVTARGLRKIPSGYAGLNWFNLNAISRDFQGGSEGYVNGNTSGDHSCYTSSGHPAELWSDRPFGFHSVMLSAAWLMSEGEVAKIESWLGNSLIASDLVTVSALGPVHYAPMLKTVTRIRLSSGRYWQLVVDDLTLSR